MSYLFDDHRSAPLLAVKATKMGLLDISDIKAGETRVISGADGSFGSLACHRQTTRENLIEIYIFGTQGNRR